MPKRTRSHCLEDISLAEFRKLLPDDWICRQKGCDYGVDMEVEIFDAQGNSTGLIFYVQIKATDNVKKERSVRLKMDRLKYLASLDIPSMLVRYCDATKATHFMWLSNVRDQIHKFSAESVTINFDKSDAWDSETSFKLLQTVKIYRLLRSSSRSLPLGLTIDDEGQVGSKVFELKLAVSELQRMSNMIVSSKEEDQCLPVVLRIHGEIITVSIDVVTSAPFEADRLTSESILSELIYILAYMTGRFEFRTQTDELIRIIQANEFTTSTRFFACRVAELAINEPIVAADIAHRNGLHLVQDFEYFEYLIAMLSSVVPIEKRKSAIKTFFTDAMSAIDPEEKERLSATYYSFANSQMQSGCYTHAIVNYNFARKLDKAYLKRPYFLSEFAACCFFRGRFKAAARLYATSYEMAPDTQVGVCAGDAMLYSGDFTGAREIFEKLCEETTDYFISSEVRLKAWLSSWLIEFYQLNKLSGTSVLNCRAFWFNVIDQATEEKIYDSAIGAALMEGFLCDGDEKLWADAMLFSAIIGDCNLMVHTFSCAIRRNGYEVYALFRKKLEEHQFSSEGLEHFDQLAGKINQMRPIRKSNEGTFRLLGSIAEQVKILS